ncbi:hypothetical protein BASA50_010249 [Batrachochytrium salamandrivorans]|uniref:Uncharacterized protein n=1 Tax=Batrachochytrium salamandrivorans TaxID=1357716 RepID=A0ABQ8EZF7_9FUNG|nr:hypothetical protein BASA62_007131 [Batrachochytrium salamandrivorans]KAH6572038.1 hypothetical protein BASA60_006809 [Batrachochytrium salamandrivorans]KAH6589084.1 hypothetical protein BASA50_010249 [Batrachochytrium salamandrivorans]KAH6599336.1 hypothetical protein BASA61_002592 [Batrachochytrium salamandrivorans]KAH9273334.1 hypothetical protein BASA83_004333 [Batrachochytrium salamandrivorans]
MQLFYLFSFVVVASYAAALPQPAELSEQYSNDADTNLAFGLETRSYQPGLNSQKDLATLTLLKRQDNSEDNGDGSDLPPLLTPQGIQDVIDNFFTDDDFISANMASTIDRVGDGAVGFYKDGEKAGKEIGDPAGPMLARYIERAIYVIVALVGWIEKDVGTIFLAIKSVVSEAKYTEILQTFITALRESTKLSSEKEGEVVKAVSNILTKTGTVIESVNTIHTSFKDAFHSRAKPFILLGSPLKGFESTKILYENIFNAMKSLGKFLTDQRKIHKEIIKALEPPPSE